MRKLKKFFRCFYWLVTGRLDRFVEETSYFYRRRFPARLKEFLPGFITAAYARKGKKGKVVPVPVSRFARFFRGRPTLVLHIGLPKTGTTFLQKRVFALQEQLPYFGKEGRTPSRISNDLNRMFRFASPASWRDYSKFTADDLEALANGVPARSSKTILYSDENYFTSTTSIVNGARDLCPVRLAEHLRWFRKHFWKGGPFRLVLGLRRQDYWLISNYAEQAFRKELSCQEDFEKKVAAILSPGARDPDVPFLDYALYVELVAEAIGRDNLHVMLMEDLQEDPVATLASLDAFLGQPLSKDPAVNIEVRDNVKSAGDNRWQLSKRKIRNPRLQHREAERETHVELTPQLSARIMEACHASNRRFEKLIGRDLSRFGY